MRLHANTIFIDPSAAGHCSALSWHSMKREMLTNADVCLSENARRDVANVLRWQVVVIQWL